MTVLALGEQKGGGGGGAGGGREDSSKEKRRQEWLERSKTAVSCTRTGDCGERVVHAEIPWLNAERCCSTAFRIFPLVHGQEALGFKF